MIIRDDYDSDENGEEYDEDDEYDEEELEIKKYSLSGYDGNIYSTHSVGTCSGSTTLYIRKGNTYYNVVNSNYSITYEENLAYFSDKYRDGYLKIYTNGNYVVENCENENCPSGKVGYILYSDDIDEIDIIPKDNVETALIKYDNNNEYVEEYIIIYKDNTYKSINYYTIYNNINDLINLK